ncbi:MAG: UDP-N-acetylmuramate:L-alanyl-gamma-D-glutamyl-meso-diaminopimelate ligase [Legionellales bacterium RIFCSPHIGHO2_12_FULL_42_9]|nr:MAG: UDP-N-acetylmuramate:L-alanyl-gamma-D-glutamyl-meso-diaminopimelate ligase [Legionellales bacterium RIFCSPHIGHO2_12_FULL_42_9]
MHIHVLGIGGTFMSALALLAREAGFYVTGSDTNCYPPMSDLLLRQGIEWVEGYEACTHAREASLVIVGNAMKRGMPVIEAMLDARTPYTSGPQWLAEQILSRYRVLAVAGTHGKTTTTSMLAYILHEAGLQPGFLIGGIATDFGTNACLGQGAWFVIEADEYDSAFFDKRPKFMHYRPDLAVLTNLEFDHADIYADLAAIQQQFHYFLKTIPPSGLVLHPRDDVALQAVLARGQFSRVQTLALSGEASWQAELLDEAGRAFVVFYEGQAVAEIHWSLIGRFNVENGLAALAASVYAGVEPVCAARALATFSQVKRRLEVKSDAHGVTVYDDFAHHPTAIEKTIQALRQSGRHQRIFAVTEFASYTMRMGVHGARVAHALAGADATYLLSPTAFSLHDQFSTSKSMPRVFSSTEDIVQAVEAIVQPGDAVVVMSNRGFEGIHQRLIASIDRKFNCLRT